MKNIVAIIFVAFVAVTMGAPKSHADPTVLYSHLPSTYHAYPYAYNAYPYYYGGYPSHSGYPFYGYGYNYPAIQTYSAYNVEGVPVVV